MIGNDFTDIPGIKSDSTTCAIVGSIGNVNNLFPAHYRFELNLYNTLRAMTKQISSENKDLIWYVDTKQYWKLKYDFEIEE
jgi:hypothetical protein